MRWCAPSTRIIVAARRCSPKSGASSSSSLNNATQGDSAPWLHELAHYEWVELALQIADDDLPPHDPDGDLLAGKPVPSPLAWALAYCLAGAEDRT
jgi:hypothetical protein